MNRKIFLFTGIIILLMLTYVALAKTYTINRNPNSLNRSENEADNQEVRNKDKIQGWKIFLNERYNYTMKYPPTLEVEILKEDEIIFFVKNDSYFGIRTVGRNKKTSLKEVALSDIDSRDETAKRTKIVTNTTVNDQESILITFDTEIPYPQKNIYSYYISNKGIFFNIVIYKPEEPFSQKEFTELIIENFSFGN